MKPHSLWHCLKNGAALLTGAIVLLLGHAGPATAADPFLAGIASAIVPGTGQAANGDYGVAAAHFGVFATSVYGVIHYKDRSDWLDADQRYDAANNREFINQTTLRYDYAARLATDTALYSGYGAYRDARSRDNSGYRTPAPSETLGDLAKAPFSFNFLSRPTTFIPLAIEAALLYRDNNTKDAYGIYRAQDVSERDLHVFNFTSNEMTAVGEEGFFRGFLNNDFSNRYGDGWGVVWSSVIFGLAHTGQGQTANALQATAAGFYFGWLHQKNGYQAGEGAALHYWFNVLAGISAIHNVGSAELLHIELPF